MFLHSTFAISGGDWSIGTFKAGRISHLMRFVMIKFKFRSDSHETGN